MNVCFLTISIMTPLYHAIATRLERAGHSVCWISPSRRWSEWLTDRGVPRDRVLDITRHAAEWVEGRPDLSVLDGFESRASKSVRDLILMDRLVSERDEGRALAYAASCVRHAESFLEARGVDVVFAEPSYLLAYVVFELCAQRGIRSYNVDTVRFPDGRFGLFPGMFQKELAGSADVTEVDREAARLFHAVYLETHAKPAYFYANRRVPKVRPVLAWKFVRNLRRVLADPHDESGFPVRRMVRDQIARTWNHASVTRWEGLHVPDGSGRPFLLYGLHKQPELGIDVWASYLSDQAALITALARSVPVTHDLYVKVHSNDLGGRPRRFFEQLAEIPGVRIVDPMVDSHQLIQQADLVMSITGSMAFEAGLYGRRSLAFAEMFFSPLLVASGVDPYALTRSDIATLLARPHPRDDPDALNPVEFLASVHARSFPGIVGDPLTDPRIMVGENLDVVGRGFAQFLDALPRD